MVEDIQQKKIQNFTDLEAWRAGHVLVVKIYKLTREFPKDEQFELTSQIRRAAVSITSNIAEGFSRQSLKEKMQFFSIAKGSVTEVQNQLLVSRDVGYLPTLQYQESDLQAVQVSKLITGLLKYLRAKQEAS